MSLNSITPSRDLGNRAEIAKISDGLQRILARGERSDIQFTVGRFHGAEKVFPAHRLIVGVRSAVLHAALDKMFSGTVPGSYTAHIDVPDVHPEAFANMLSYIYTDDVKNLSRENAFHTLLCADKYGLPLLGTICTNFILNQISIDSCLDLLDMAVRFGEAAPSVVEKCLCLIDKSVKTVWESDRFSEIGEEALRNILERDTLTASEDTIYYAVDKWAAQMCTRQHMDASSASRRKVLGQTFFLIRFPLLTDAQLMNGPVKNGLLLQSEGWDIYRYKHATVKPCLPFLTESRQKVRVEGIIDYTVLDVGKQWKTVSSGPIRVGKLLWSIVVHKGTDEELPVLGFYMSCSDYPESDLWACRVTAELRLLPWNAKVAPIKSTTSHLFCKEEDSWGYSDFIFMEDLLDPANGYVGPKDFSVKLQVHLTAYLPAELA